MLSPSQALCKYPQLKEKCKWTPEIIGLIRRAFDLPAVHFDGIWFVDEQSLLRIMKLWNEIQGMKLLDL